MPAGEIFYKQLGSLVDFLAGFVSLVISASFLSGFVSFDTFRDSSLSS